MKTIIAVWVLGVAIVAWFGRLPNPYLEHVRQIPPPHPYPVEGVLWVIFLLTVQTIIVTGLLRLSTYNRSWGRALMALLVSMAFLCFAAMAAMHAPPYLVAYLWWLLGVAVMVAALFVWSGIGAFRSRAGI